jgi:hypothetical protein
MTAVASAGAYLLSTPVELEPNAGGEPRPKAGAQRTLEGVGFRPMLGAVSRCLRVRPRFSLGLGTSVPYMQRSSLPRVMVGHGCSARQILSSACPPTSPALFYLRDTRLFGPSTNAKPGVVSMAISSAPLGAMNIPKDSPDAGMVMVPEQSGWTV